MPHIIVKLYPGRSEEQKEKLSGEIARSTVSILGCDDKAVSVSFEEVSPEEWPGKVYKPDILDKKETLYKKPGYNPFE